MARMATRRPTADVRGDQWIEGADGIEPVDDEMVPHRALVAQHIQAVR